MARSGNVGLIRALFVLFCAALAPTDREAEAQAASGLSGTVVARGTSQPVADATVTAEGSGATVATNALGRFELPTGAAPVTLVVRARGYLELKLPGVQAQTGLVIELDPTPNFLEAVQVTATKSALVAGDVAAPTTSVSRQTIDLRGDQRLTEAVEHVPGALITTELGIFENVLLRGMPRQGNEFTNTLLLIDGVPQTNSGNEARVVALPINDARSIEVVRGPNSALYGRTAIGGAVNLLTADPTTTPQLRVDLAGGQFGTARGVVAASGPIARWGGFYASVGTEHGGGYFNDLVDPDYDTGNVALFGKLKFTTSPRSFGSVTINRVSSNNSTPTNEPVVDGQFLHEIDPQFDRLTNLNLPGPTYSQGETRFTANYNWQFSDWGRFVETFGYRDVRLEFIEDGDFIGEPYNLTNQTVTMYPFSQELNESIFYQEARLEAGGTSGSVRHDATIGWSYEDNSGDLWADFIYTDEDLFGFPDISYVNPVIPDRSVWQHDEATRVYNLGITGIFGQYMVQPTSRLLLTAAGRYDRLNMDATRGTGVTVEQTFDAFSPKVSATYRFFGNDSGRALNAYGAYSQAFNPPRRPSALIPADIPLNLQPVDVENWETGIKGSLADGAVSLEASYFHMTEDGVVLSQRQGAFFLPTNAGQRKYDGFETGLGWSASSKISTYVNASFYHHRFGDFVIESEEGDLDLEGNHLVLSPAYIVNWGAVFQITPAIDARFDVKHVGPTFGDDENSYRIPGYSLVDVAASWLHGSGLRITLSARNLFDEEYYFDASDSTADPAPPRQVLISTTIRFR